jgi:glycine/D-amino acid oxidase-like deaminating enzyme
MLRVTPPDYRDAESGWAMLTPPAAPRPALGQDVQCDYAIVGAGWTGIAAAHRLAALRPDARIVLLDAGCIGAGAAGRNSGFLFDVPFVFAPDAYRGREEAGRQEIRLYRAAHETLRGLIDRTALGSNWLEIGQHHGAVAGPGMRELETVEAGLRALGEPYRRIERGGLQDELGTDVYAAAIHTPGTVQINPLAVLRAYAGALPDSVTIYEESPVTAVEPGSAPIIRTSAGTVRAKAVLLTTNAFLRHFENVSPPLVPVATFAALTKAAGHGHAGNQTWGVVPTALFGTSLRRLPDGRLLVRSTYAPSFSLRFSAAAKAKARRRQRLSLARRFPDLPDAGFELEWSGLVSFFRGASGYLSTVAPGVHAGVTSGMPVCMVYGAALADHVLEQDGPNLDFIRGRSAQAPLPPAAILRPAASMLAAWRQFKERREI